MLSLYLDNNTLFNDVMDHGCQCARFDPLSQKNILGGNRQFDDLDSICRDWYSARQCLNKYDRGSCLDLDNTNYSYQVAITVEPSTSEINNAFCNELHSATSLPYNDCELDSCKVDIHYVKQIRDFLANNPSFTSFKVVDGTSCPINSAPVIEDKYCAGDAPNVYIEIGIPPNTTTITTTTEIPVIKEYGSTAAGHLVFIVDRSSENNITQYNEGIDFIVSVVSPLVIAPNATVISIIGMSDVNNIYVTEATSMAEFNAVIDFVRTDQASVPDRDMAGAVDMASQLLGLRSLGFLLELTIVLITGGVSSTSGDVVDTNTGQVVNIYEEVHALNITVMSVGIGNNVNETELAQVASDPVLEFIIDVVDAFVDIVERVQEVYVQVANGLPPTATPPPDPTTTMTTTTMSTSTSTSGFSTPPTTTDGTTSALASTSSALVTTTLATAASSTTPGSTTTIVSTTATETTTSAQSTASTTTVNLPTSTAVPTSSAIVTTTN